MGRTIKRIIGAILIIAGIALIVISHIITTRVEEGKIQVASAQKQVNKSNQLFSLSPYTKDVGKQVSGSAQKKIDAGKLTIEEYAQMAQWMQIGGSVLIVVGIGVVFIGKRKKKR